MLQNPTSEEDARLISKVLTINLMKQAGNNNKSAITQLVEQIGQILNVNFIDSNLKFYGSESQYIEFKTSIVYPADNKMQPDADRQHYEIAKVICRFLNAEGGTLYIGVNDQGYECGVQSDLEYYKAANMDKYILRIESLIENQLGSTANDDIQIIANEGTKYSVVAIKIKPSQRVAYMKNVRHTTSTRAKQGTDLDIFTKDRKIRYMQIEQSLK